MDGVEDVEEVLPRRALVLRILGGEVLGEVGVLLEVGPEAADGELVVLRHLHLADLLLLEELLLAGEHVLEEVLVDDGLVGQVELNYNGVKDCGLGDLRCWSR